MPKRKLHIYVLRRFLPPGAVYEDYPDHNFDATLNAAHYLQIASCGAHPDWVADYERHHRADIAEMRRDTLWLVKEAFPALLHNKPCPPRSFGRTINPNVAVVANDAAKPRIAEYLWHARQNGATSREIEEFYDIRGGSYSGAMTKLHATSLIVMLEDRR